MAATNGHSRVLTTIITSLWPDRSSRGWCSASIIQSKDPGWPQPLCGAGPDNQHGLMAPSSLDLALITPLFAFELTWNQACQTSIPWSLHPPSALQHSFTLESVGSEKYVLGWMTFSETLLPGSLVPRGLLFNPDPVIYVIVSFPFFLLRNSMIYSLWHEIPRKCNFNISHHDAKRCWNSWKHG